MSHDSDVLIIGAGPSGTVAACLLQQYGLQVRILERDYFPRFVIGESLLPQLMTVLEEANLDSIVNAAGYQLKNGSVFHRGTQQTEFDSSKKISPGPSQTWQVPRAHFDSLLADTAMERGVHIAFGHNVTACQLSQNNCSITCLDDKEQEQTYSARFVLDASGYGRVLARQLHIEKPLPKQISQSLFTHIEDHIDNPEFDREKIHILVHPQHHQVWYWLIPFSHGRCSIGVVAEPDFFQGLSPNKNVSDIKSCLMQEPLLRELLCNAIYDRPVHFIDSYACDVENLYGDGYALLGNAANFIDPIFSSGLTLALNSASLAAPLIHKSINGIEVDWENDYSNKVRHGINVFHDYITSWYNQDLQDLIFQPRANDGVKAQIAAVLAGYVWDEENPFTRQACRRIASLAQISRSSPQDQQDSESNSGR